MPGNSDSFSLARSRKRNASSAALETESPSRKRRVQMFSIALPSGEIARFLISRVLFLMGTSLTSKTRGPVLEFLNAAMRERNLCRSDEYPIVDLVKMFLIFSSDELATSGLLLNGISYQGSILTIERPKKYSTSHDVSSMRAESEDNSGFDSKNVGEARLRKAVKPKLDDIDRKLFVDNLNVDIDDIDILVKEFFAQVLANIGLVDSDSIDTMVTDVQVNTRKRCAFLTLATPEIATAALVLNQVPFMGTTISVQRRFHCAGAMDVDTMNWKDLLRKRTSTYQPVGADIGLSDEVFITNLPDNVSETALSLFCSSALEQIGLTILPGSPITQLRFHDTYCFIKFRSHVEATNALCLKGIPFMGRLLAVSRPAKSGACDHRYSWKEALATLRYSNAYRLHATSEESSSSPKRSIVAVSTSMSDTPRRQVQNDSPRENVLGQYATESKLLIKRKSVSDSPPNRQDSKPNLFHTPASDTLSHSSLRLNNDAMHQELFVTDFDPSFEDQHELLKDYVNQSMIWIFPCSLPSGPAVVASSLVRGERFSYWRLLFSSPRGATGALMFDGMPFLGSILSFTRPSRYKCSTENNPLGWNHHVTKLAESYRPQHSESSSGDINNLALYVGNVSPNATSALLKMFFGSAMEQLGLSSAAGSPVSSARLFRGGYAFIRLRTADEATYGLCLDQIPFMETRLAVSRPSKWRGPKSDILNWEEIMDLYRQPPCDQSVELSRQPKIGKPGTDNHRSVMEESFDQAHGGKKEEAGKLPQRVFHLDGMSRDRSSGSALTVGQVSIGKNPVEESDHGKRQAESIQSEEPQCFSLKTSDIRALPISEERYGTEVANHPIAKENRFYLIEELERRQARASKAADEYKVALGDLNKKYGEAQLRNQRIVESLSNAMDELMTERKSRRELEAIVESLKQCVEAKDEASENLRSKFELAQQEISRLKAELGRVRESSTSEDSKRVKTESA